MADPAGSFRLAVYVQPRAGRDQVVGRHGEELKLRLAAPAVDGAANEACVRFVAELFGLKRSRVGILQGLRDRHKVLALAGDPALLQLRLEALLDGDVTATAAPSA